MRKFPRCVLCVVLSVIFGAQAATGVGKDKIVLKNEAGEMEEIQNCDYKRMAEFVINGTDILYKSSPNDDSKEGERFVYYQPVFAIILSGCKLIRASREQIHVLGHEPYFEYSRFVFDNYYAIGEFPAIIKIYLAEPQYLPKDLLEELFYTLGPITLSGEIYLQMEKAFQGKDGQVYYLNIIVKPTIINGKVVTYPTAPAAPFNVPKP